MLRNMEDEIWFDDNDESLQEESSDSHETLMKIKKTSNTREHNECPMVINLRNEHDNCNTEDDSKDSLQFCNGDCFKDSCCKEIHNRKSCSLKEILRKKSSGYCFASRRGKKTYYEDQAQFQVDLPVISKCKESSSQICSKVLFSKVERDLGSSVHPSYLRENTRDDVCLLTDSPTSNILRTCHLEKNKDIYDSCITISETGTFMKSWFLFYLEIRNIIDESIARKTSVLQNNRRLKEQQLKNFFLMIDSDVLIHEDEQVKVKEMIANIGETINKNGSSDVIINDARDQTGCHGLTFVIRDIEKERRFKEKQIRYHLKIFLKNNADLINHEDEIVNQENQTEKMKQMDVNNVKSIKDGKCDEAINEDGKDQSENQGLIDVFPELFKFVEVRTGTDIVVCPATQQLVLEPFLNRFSTPDNKPSKHDTMAMEFLRLCSMHDYPSKQGPSLLRLAEAGFYYEGNGDELICFSCGVRNRNWSFGDSPREIHQRLSPGCKFLTEGGDGNVQVPRDQPTEELASHQTNRKLETDGLNVPDSASAREPANNTAHLSSAGYSQLRSESPQPVMAIKHPEYTARSARLGSYQTFPRHMKQHPADMTDAGFYYAGFGDCCRCFHCGIGLRNWDPEDNPWIEHARWSAECPYILKMKGQAFIDLVQEAARAAEMADNDGDNEADNESASTQSKSAVNEKSGANNSVPKAPAGNSSYEVENNVAKASEAEISKGTPEEGGSSAGNTIEAKPIKAPLRTAAAQSLIHDEHVKPKFVTAAIDELVKTEGWGAFSLENIRKYLKIQEDNRKSATSASNADPSMLKQENKELKDLTICKICLDEKVSIVFLPCGHLVSCPQCAPALTKCPICRKGIKGTVRTNLVEKNTLKSNALDRNNPKTNTKKT